MPDSPSKNSPGILSPAIVAAEKRAREFLTQHKWRKARDEIKPLFKADRERYLPMLLEANSGLAREMFGKGQVAEAREVLAYLRTIAPASQLRNLELEIGVESARSGDFMTQCAEALADPAVKLTDAERFRLADHVVLAFQPISSSPSLAGLSAELKAIHAGLEAVSNGRWDGLADIIRAVSHRSVFSHWALFIKGVAAFHMGDRDRTRRFFDSLPAGSVPARASKAYSLLTQNIEWRNVEKPNQTVLDAMCRLTGHAPVGQFLLQADRLWLEGKHADSYMYLRSSIRQFPSRELDWPGSLTHFYFSAYVTLSETAGDVYFSRLDDLLAQNKAKSDVERMLLLRVFAFRDANLGCDFELREDWEEFLSVRSRLKKTEPRFSSLAYAWLGAQFAQRYPASYLSERVKLRNPGEANSALLKAIELDSANLEAHLKLCEVYAALDRLSDRNRLLDQMTERFPQEKSVFLETARFCIERQAYTKSLGLLDSAWQLDRLDPRIPEMIATARYSLARQQYQRKQADKGREVLAGVEPFITDVPDDLHRGRWTFLARKGVLERLHGDSERAKALLEDARKSNPFASAYLYFAHFANRLYSAANPADLQFLQELKAHSKKECFATQAILLLRIFQYWEKALGAGTLEKEAGWLKGYLQAALKQPWTRIEARQIVELCGSGRFIAEARGYIKRVLRKDPKDPLFRFLEYLIDSEFESNSFEAHDQLNAILTEAHKRGDHETSQRVQQALQNARYHRPPVPPSEPWLDNPDENRADYEFEDAPEDLEDLMPAIPPELKGSLTQLVEGLRHASDADIQRMRETRPDDIPLEMFEMLVNLAKGPGLLPKPRGSGPIPPPPMPPTPAKKVDKNQLELF